MAMHQAENAQAAGLKRTIAKSNIFPARISTTPQKKQSSFEVATPAVLLDRPNDVEMSAQPLFLSSRVVPGMIKMADST